MIRTYQQSYEILKSGLERLSQQEGSAHSELMLRCLEELKTDADQTKRELLKLRGMLSSRHAERMSSKLKEALRE